MTSHMEWELCQSCGGLARIRAGRTGVCVHCGSRVLPCSTCKRADCTDCPHDRKNRIWIPILRKVSDGEKEKTH